MKSKNHHIDKLFADKLSDLESNPSAEAWMALEKGLLQNKKKRRGVWFTYSAAAAVALIIVGFLWFGRQSDTTIIASHPTTLPEKNIISGKQTKNINSSIDTEKTNAEIEKIVANQTDKLIAQTTERQKERPVKINSDKAVEKVVQPMPAVEKQPAVKAKMPTVPTEEQIAILDVRPEVIQETALSNTIVVKVELEDTNETAFAEAEVMEEPERQTKAGKILDKLIKLKKGEFNQLGVKPETLVAFVKEKANNALTNNRDDK